jgi:predicted transcriptional regulator
MAPTDSFHLFGPLEREIMAILWRDEQATVRDVWRQILATRSLAYTTVMTGMVRLAEKGLLTQERQGAINHHPGYRYRPALTRGALMQLAVEDMWNELGATDSERRALAEALQG